MKKSTKATATSVATDKTVVYCGPTVKGICKQFTVYTGELPQDMAAYVSTRPAAKGLLVPLEHFAQVRCKLNQEGSAEAILYESLLTE